METSSEIKRNSGYLEEKNYFVDGRSKFQDITS